ncbi:MAG: SapC family protein [Paracoccaceae bacterium]
MTAQLLFYEKPVAVSATAHRETCIKATDDFSFAKSVNSVPLVAAEFAEAGAEFPIVFAGQDKNIVPTAILGVAGGENQFVDDNGAWTARFMPVFIRRYPFVFSQANEDGRALLFVDEAYPGVNNEGRGERLFDAEGNQTQYLASVLAFLEDYQVKFRRTQQYCQRLIDLDLLRPMEAQFNVPGAEPRRLTGFLTIDREKLKAIDTDVLKEMFDTDELECTFLHLASLRHFATLADQAAKNDEGAAAPTEPEPEAEAVDGE